MSDQEIILYGNPTADVPSGVIHYGPGKYTISETAYTYELAGLPVIPPQPQGKRYSLSRKGNAFALAAARIRAKTPTKLTLSTKRRGGR